MFTGRDVLTRPSERVDTRHMLRNLKQNPPVNRLIVMKQYGAFYHFQYMNVMGP